MYNMYGFAVVVKSLSPPHRNTHTHKRNNVYNNKHYKYLKPGLLILKLYFMLHSPSPASDASECITVTFPDKF